MSQNQKKNKLVFEGSHEAFKYLQELWKSGELEQLLGVSVVNVSLWEDLIQWFNNSSGENWQPLEPGTTVTDSSNISTNTSPETTLVTRAKIIDLEGQSVVLIITLKPVEKQVTDIGVQIEPTANQAYLPAELQLIAIDKSGNTVSQAQAGSTDKRMQLELKCSLGAKFRVKVSLGEISTTENFVLDSQAPSQDAFVEAIETSVSRDLLRLSQWLEGIFQETWQPVELVLGNRYSKLAWGVARSSYSNLKISRAKKIDLGLRLNNQTVALVITVKSETAAQIGVLVQVVPVGEDKYLPPGLKLIVNLESDSAEVEARSKDNWIQLELSEALGKPVTVQVGLEDAMVTQEFIV